MIPPANHPTWARLVKGELRAQFTQASAGLLLGTLNREYQRDPARLELLILQARAFFAKYERALTVDIARLFG